MIKEKRASTPSILGRISRRFSLQPSEDPGYEIFPIPTESHAPVESEQRPGLARTPDLGAVTHRLSNLDLLGRPLGEKKREIDTVPGCAAPLPLAPGTQDTRVPPVDEDSYIIEFENDTLWPCFEPNDGNSEWECPDILVNFSDPARNDWIQGRVLWSEFGARMFPPRERSHLPPCLFDLETNCLVRSSDIPDQGAEYVAVSHVWGDSVTEVPGRDYGVEWEIPIQSSQKLRQILSACQAVGGIRYIWMDVLCLDQRRTNKGELWRMRRYFESAAGCLVWLDNIHYDPNWNQVLFSIREVNRAYHLGWAGSFLASTEQTREAERDGLPVIPPDALSCFGLVRNLTRMERAPWFKRVWTLQEGIIPERVIFATPERYLIDRSCMFKLAAALGEMAQRVMDHGLRWGVGLLQELQRSEIWKMLKLKQLYAAKKISYQHIFHALKTRRCKHEGDRLFGVLGLLRRSAPITLMKQMNIAQDIDTLFYKSSVESGEFSSLFFLGGSIWHAPESIGLVLSSRHIVRSVPPSRQHDLSFGLSGGLDHPSKLMLQNVGYDLVTSVCCLSGKGYLAGWVSDFQVIDNYQAKDIATACGIPGESADSQNEKLEPGFMAATLPWKTRDEGLLKGHSAEFLERVRFHAVRTVVMALQCRWLEAHLDHSAVVVLWTSQSGPQLAVVTEAIGDVDEGKTLTVMPRSYMRDPGTGCLVCIRDETGHGLRKIGIGLGESLWAKGIHSFEME